ncbi:TerB family tellurite resistance protein [Thalassospira alkalitolerans]|uniref:Molecular chaperone DnaJ n=1 Tax=Thalassospira alkalitolerans TaxID=1293890 RepID=A0A1Y2LEZ4_9PROT|nr:TerB family tellurite resistance protein [Thalassospira alkalitolerans]OSQ49540.1 molecular chaperone DnaJ [Thalassospira alkalitolerans]
MSIWGKIIGGTAGFALGGPLGAILGTAAGHVVDKIKQGARNAQFGAYGGTGQGSFAGGQDSRQIAFATAVVVLSAKMAKVDGVVSRDEIDAFKRVFHIPPGEEKNVGRLFDMARKSSDGFEPYAQQIALLFRGERAILEGILEALYQIAMADGQLHPAEKKFLHKVATIFGFADVDFDRVHHAFTSPGADPYEQLGLTRDASDDDLKSAHRQLSRENHPDTLIAKGMPPEFVEQANDKMARINAAWDQIRKERNIR